MDASTVTAKYEWEAKEKKGLKLRPSSSVTLVMEDHLKKCHK